MTDSARAQLADRLHLDDSPRRAIRVGAIVAFLFFVVGLGWAALARLDAAAAGEGHVSPKSVVSRVDRALRDGAADREEHVPATALRPRRAKRDGTGVGVHVEGLDDIMIRLSRCCSPVPPDDIIGFVTRGRGVSVHRSDCLNAATLSALL